jgi:glutamate-1-semialdehyde-2,1-aminomutase
MAETKGVIQSKSMQSEKILSMLLEIVDTLFGAEAPTSGGTGGVDPDATFFELGADSLSLLQFSQAIQNKFNVKIPFRRLLEELPTLSSVAAYINEQARQEPLTIGVATAEPEPVAPPQEIAEAAPQPNLPEAQQTPQPPSSFEAVGPISVKTVAAPTRPAASNGSKADHAGMALAAEVLAQQVRLMSRQIELLRELYVSGDGFQEAPVLATALQQMVQPATSASEAVEPKPAVLTCSPQPSAAPDAKKEAPGRKIEPEPFVPYAPITKGAGGLNARQQKHLDELITRITRRTQQSKYLTQRHRRSLADSRASAKFRLVWKEMLYPIIVERAAGARVWDVDGNEYVDLTMGFGSLLFGHNPDFITEALEQQLKKGIQIGLRSNIVGNIADLICEMTGVERVAFCNSGTEAVMTALRLARTITGRSKIALFEGSYHGTFDEVLVRAERVQEGDLVALPLAPGIPQHLIDQVLLLNYDSARSLEILRAHGRELAAVLIEPPRSRRPDLRPESFLHSLREITEESGAALIFDEVVTGFRFHPGGAQTMFNVKADLVTYGKAMGGGLPVAVVAGKAAYMDAIDGGMWNYGDSSYPRAETTYFAGTYFQHPLVMAAVWAALNYIHKSGLQLQEQLERRASYISSTLNDFFEREQVPMQVAHIGSLFRFHHSSSIRYIDVFYYHLLEKGVYICETRGCFLSTAHTDADVEQVIQAVKESVWEVRAGGFLPEPSTPPRPNRNPSIPQADESSAIIAGSTAAANFASSPVARSDEASVTPLTEAQKHLWVLAQLGDDASSAYNQSLVLELRGWLDMPALRKAMQRLVDRHEVLRTVFSEDGEYQRALGSLSVDVALSDLSHTRSEERDETVRDAIKHEIKQVFDLAKGPPLRARIIRLEQELHYLVLTIHHIVTDGLANGVLLKELSKLYSAECRGVVCQLPEPTPFSKYVRREADRGSSSEAEQARAYWLEQFSTLSPALELPLDRPRPAIQTYNGALEHATINDPLYAKLKELSAKQGVTLFTTLLAGYCLLLHKLSGQDDIVVAVPAAGQLRSPGSKQLVGYCINMLPLRSRLTDRLTFTQYVLSIKDRVLDSYEHQAYHFAELLKDLRMLRDRSRTPIFSTTFNLDRSSSASLDFHGLQAKTVAGQSGSAKFDISLNVTETGVGLKLEFEYNTDLFDVETIKRWINHFQTLLEAAADNPSSHLFELSLLSQEELSQIIDQGDEARADQRDDISIYKLFEAQVERSPQATALVFNQEQLTYQQVEARASALAAFLRARGVGRECVVAICMPRGPDVVVSMLAVLKAGGAYLPLDPAYPSERLAYMLDDSRARLVLTHCGSRERLGRCRAEVVCLDCEWEQLARAETQRPGVRVDEVCGESLAYVIYTSGSTGRPKGVKIPHRAVVNFLYSMRREPGLTAEDVLLAVTTISFDIAALELFLPLVVGAKVVIASPEELADAAKLLDKIASSGATVMQATPAAWRMLLEMGWQGSERLKILCGGEALPRELADQLRARCRWLWNMYGPTETTIWSALHRIESQSSVVPIGHPISNTGVYLLDAFMQHVPVGVAGELYIGGAGLAHGYYNRADLTAERFIPHPLTRKPGARLYRTGDLARYLPGGEIEFLGRADRQVKIRGHRIELGEIESALEKIPAVKQSVVLDQANALGEKRLTAYLVAEEALDPKALRAALKEVLPDYMLPSGFVVINAFPLTSNDKVDRKALPAFEQAPSAPESYVAPRNEAERILAGIWKDLLGVERVGVHDNFFELGGDSITSIRIVSKANAAGLRLTAMQVFKYQTVAELAAAAETTRAAVSEPQAAAGELPLTPIQHWFFGLNLPAPDHFNMMIITDMSSDMDPVSLEAATRHLLSHHDSLRSRFRKSGSVWHQSIVEPDDAPVFSYIDLSEQSGAESEAVFERFGAAIQASLDLAQGPLMRVALFNLGPENAKRLIITIHHLAVDIISYRILIEDLRTAYESLRRGQRIKPAPKTTSFKEWAENLLKYAQSPELKEEMDYWLAKPWHKAEPLPVDYPGGVNDEASVAKVSLSLSPAETAMLLREIPRSFNTQINDALLTALAGGFRQWVGRGPVLIALEGHGREALFDDVDLSRTVGWFTSICPLLLDTEAALDPGEAVKIVRKELRLLPHGGIGFGILRYLSGDGSVIERLRAIPTPQVSFNHLGKQEQSKEAPARGQNERPINIPGRSPRNARPFLIEINSAIADDVFTISWRYSRNVHRSSTVERLAEAYLESLRSIINHCHAPAAGAFSPSDFKDFKWDQDRLNTIATAIAKAKGEASR